MIRYKLAVLVSVVLASFGIELFGREYEIISPDKGLHLKVDVEQKILYSLGYKSKQLIKPSPISLTLCGNMRLVASPERLFVSHCARLSCFPGQCQFTRSSLQAIAILAAPWAR